MILGVDEVGRGAWAGPLVVGAVVLGEAHIHGLTDSKALTKKRRDELAVQICSQAAAYGLGWVSAADVDQIGLSEALRVATKDAVRQVQATATEFHEIIIDGTVNFLSDTPLGSHVTTLKKADLLIESVSAAAIIAKVARDTWMANQDNQYPGYGFAGHVGYGTAKHREAIATHGVTPLHRLSFAPLKQYALSDTQQGSTVKAQPTTRDVGNESETAAAEYLHAKGYEIVDRNWKTRWCEIDIVVKKNDRFYFVEVKHRHTSASGDGVAAITSKKLAQMKKAAELYAARHDIDDICLAVVATSGAQYRVDTFMKIE